jgi:hypothetical protein
MYIDDLDDTGSDVSAFLLALGQEGNTLYLQEQGNSLRWHLFSIDADAVAAAGYVRFPTITNIDSGFDFSGQNVQVSVCIGVAGDVGTTGPTGLTGETGATGDTGAIGPQASRTLTVESPSSSEDISFLYTPDAWTVTELIPTIRGATGEELDWTIRYASTRVAVGTEIITGGTATNDANSGTIITSLDSASIPADSFVWFETTGATMEIDEFSITMV